MSIFRQPVKGHAYTSDRMVEYKRLLPIDPATPRYWYGKQGSKRIVRELEADFIVEIDLPALIQRAVAQCAYTKGGRAQLLGKLVIAKRLHERVVSEVVSDIQAPEGYQWEKEVTA